MMVGDEEMMLCGDETEITGGDDSGRYVKDAKVEMNQGDE